MRRVQSKWIFKILWLHLKARNVCEGDSCFCQIYTPFLAEDSTNLHMMVSSQLETSTTEGPNAFNQNSDPLEGSSAGFDGEGTGLYYAKAPEFISTSSRKSKRSFATADRPQPEMATSLAELLST